MTKLSVCLPVYNSAATIERTLESVLTQSYRDFECIVVDNNSADDTAERVSACTDPRVRLIRNDTNIGMVGNHNKCVQIARGELIKFVHGDDWLLPQCLEKMVPAFDAPNVGLAFALRRIETTDTWWRERYGRLDGPLQPLSAVNDGRALVRRYLAVNCLGNPIGEESAVMVRRETLIAAGGFRPELPQNGDISAWLRILSRSDAAFFDEELTGRYHHADNATNAYAGSANLDHMWVLSDLVRSDQLDWALRLRALERWFMALARHAKSMRNTPRSQWVEVLKNSATNVRYVVKGQPLQFDTDIDG